MTCYDFGAGNEWEGIQQIGLQRVAHWSGKIHPSSTVLWDLVWVLVTSNSGFDVASGSCMDAFIRPISNCDVFISALYLKFTSNSVFNRSLRLLFNTRLVDFQVQGSDSLCLTLQPTTVSRSGDENRPTLVIVQNPSLSDFTFTDFTTEPCLNGFPKIPGNFQPLWPNPSSSSISEHEGLQLRLRTTGELSKVEESVLRKGNHMAEHSHWESKSRSIDSMVSDSTGNMEQVSVDVRRFKNYAFVPFEHLCGDLRPLHSNTYLCKSLQSSVHSK